MKRKIFCFDFNGKKQSQSKGKKKTIYNGENTKSSNSIIYRKKKKLTIEEYL